LSTNGSEDEEIGQEVGLLLLAEFEIEELDRVFEGQEAAVVEIGWR
jgi:hypothetical protein